MTRVVFVALLALYAAACSSGAGGSPAATAGKAPTIPIACFGLEEPYCGRAFEAAAGDLDSEEAVVYAEVGPFGCSQAEGCPNTLAARPSGQVVFERTNGEPVAIAVNAAADGTITTAPGEWFTVAVAPSSTVGQLAGQPITYSLGHCGLHSGIDVDRSWWDPIGFVDIDHGDAINAASGTFTPHDANHATFTSDAGFTVTLVRRIGEKHLPLCM